MADLDIKSETIDKALDKLVEPVYNDAVKPAINTSKSALGFCSQFIVSGIKPFMYKRIKECEYKIAEIDKKLEEKYNQIPEKNKTEPRTNILGPAVDVLKYNLEEEHIKEMFVNLISKDMNIVQQSKVLPSYIEIVKQLSNNDAETLKYFSEIGKSVFPVIKLKLGIENGYTYPSNDLLLVTEEISDTYYNLEGIVIDNLERLRLIEISFSEHLADTSIYSNFFDTFNFSEIPEGEKIDYKKGLLKITDFGKNFINICLS